LLGLANRLFGDFPRRAKVDFPLHAGFCQGTSKSIVLAIFVRTSRVPESRNLALETRGGIARKQGGD
jgi:hypothetical protein